MNNLWTARTTNTGYNVSKICLILAIALILTGGFLMRMRLAGGGAEPSTVQLPCWPGKPSRIPGRPTSPETWVFPRELPLRLSAWNFDREMHANDAVALQAQNDVMTAWNTLAGQFSGNTDLTGQDLGGLTLTAGVYCFSSSAQLTGPLVLDAQGNPDAVRVFQVASGLNTATDSSVSVINSGNACNAFWQVGSSATLGTNNSFIGNIIALTSISLGVGTDVAGRALAHNGAVTMNTNDITMAKVTRLRLLK